MKFKNIKVNDDVLIPIKITIGWGSGRKFYCLKKVERITKTQFIADGRRFRKDGGTEVGEFASAYNVGDSDVFQGKPLRDQTKEMIEFKKKYSLYNNLKTTDILLNRINIDSDVKLFKDAVEKQKEYIIAIKKLCT